MTPTRTKSYAIASGPQSSLWYTAAESHPELAHKLTSHVHAQLVMMTREHPQTNPGVHPVAGVGEQLCR